MAASFDWGLTASDVIDNYAAYLQTAEATIFARSLDDACAEVNRAFLAGGMDPSALTTDDLTSGQRLVSELAVVYYNDRVTGNTSKSLEGMRRNAESAVREIRKDANTWVAYNSETGIGTMTTFLETSARADSAYIDTLPTPGDRRWGVW